MTGSPLFSIADPLSPIPDGAISPAPHVTAQLEAEGLASLILMRLRREDRESLLPSALMDRWTRISRQVAGHNIYQWSLIGPVIHEAGGQGLRPILLKGAVQNAVVYENPSARDMVDIDVLVSPDAVTLFDQIAVAQGFNPTTEWPEDIHDGVRSLNSQMYVHKNAGPPVRLHLHWDLINASVPLHRLYGDMDVEGMRQRACPIPDDPWGSWMLHPDDHAFHELEHALKHGFEPLVTAFDAISALRRADDSAGVLQRAESVGLTWAVEGLRLVCETHGWVSTHLAARGLSGWPATWFRRRLVSDRRGGVTPLLAQLGIAGNLSKQWACLSEMLWPDAGEARRYGWREGEKVERGYPRLQRLSRGIRFALRQIR